MKKIWLISLIIILGLSAYAQSRIENKLLLVIDIQKHFTETTISDSSAKSLIENANKIIAQFNPQNVIYIQSIARVLNVSFKGFRVDTLPNLEFDPRLNILGENVFSKNNANAFKSDNISSFIKQSGKSEIVVIGLLAEHCVKETLMGGKSKGYKMFYVPEAIVAKNNESKLKAERKLQKAGIETIPISEIVK